MVVKEDWEYSDAFESARGGIGRGMGMEVGETSSELKVVESVMGPA